AKNTIRLAKKARELSVEHISSLKSRVFGEIVAAEKICKHFIKHNKKEFTKIQQVREKLNSAYEAFDREDYMIAREKVFEIVTICRSGMPSKKTSKVKIKDKVKICNKKPTVFYKVKKGDCLINIAKDKKIFDDPWLWLLIYKANRDQIRNPHYIYVGQKLFIPRNVQPADISSIRREAKSLIKNQQ
ncbi:MAG: LysM peptidoglycan-binding domain-containing protein, partial [Thermodesulfobacteriota bacterium]|nr:LysM peptidoglycan-binding domain-containing protein [Thermodesulfobacteriota bacterium]